MSTYNGTESYRPLVLISTEEESSEDEPLPSNRHAGFRAKGLVIAALGVCAIFATIVYHTSQRPQQTDVKSSILLRGGSGGVSSTCQKPADFCSVEGDTFKMADCDGDGIEDPYCYGNGQCTCIASANACAVTGPKPCTGKPGSIMCARPENWCTSKKKGQFIFSMYDCDNDGVADPFCQMSDSDEGESSCGCLRSTSGCQDNFPQKCPDLDKRLPSADLPVAPGQMSTAPGEDGVFMKSYVKKGQMVKKGAKLFSYVSKNGKIRTKYSKTSGKITGQAKVHTGDDVKSSTPIEVTDPKIFCLNVAGTWDTIPDVGQVITKQEDESCEGAVSNAKDSAKPIWSFKVDAQHVYQNGGGAKARIHQRDGETYKLVWDNGQTYYHKVPISTVRSSAVSSKTVCVSDTTGLKKGESVDIGSQLYTVDAIDSSSDCASISPALAAAVAPGTVLTKVKPTTTKPATTTSPVPTTTSKPATTTTPVPTTTAKLATTTTPEATTTPKPFSGLAPLAGSGDPVVAEGFSGTATLKSFDVEKGSFVKSGTKVATVLTKQKKTVSVKAKESGMVTKFAGIKPGDKVDAGGQLALITPIAKTTELPSVVGAKKVKADKDSVIVDWKIGGGDSLMKGDTVAHIKAGDKVRPLKYDGPDGLVLDQQKLKVPAPVKAGTDLLNVGAGLFSEWSVKVGDTVKKGDALCKIDRGGKVLSVKSKEDGTVLRLEPLSKGDKIGFRSEGKPLCSATLGHHLPNLTVKGDTKGKSYRMKDDTKKWDELVSWQKEVGDKIRKGDLYAVIQPFTAKGGLGEPVKMKAEKSGEVLARQDIRPGGVIGPRDTLIVIGRKAAAPFPLWIIILILIILGILLIWWCWPKKEEPPPPVDDKVYLYFDHNPYVFDYRPIGIKFHHEAPIKVVDFFFNSYAKTLGVKPDMLLTRIKHKDQDFNVESSHQYNDVLHKIRDVIQPLPCWPLTLTFKKPNGEILAQDYVKHPIGIAFSKQTPIVVKTVHEGSLAAEQNVEEGWEIIKIADVDVTGDHSFSHVNEMLREGCQHLDPKDPK